MSLLGTYAYATKVSEGKFHGTTEEHDETLHLGDLDEKEAEPDARKEDEEGLRIAPWNALASEPKR